MVVISIGGNNFGFGDVVQECLKAWLRPNLPTCESSQKWRMEPAQAAQRKTEIETGIEHIGEAMKDAGYESGDYTILVQDYPSPIPEPGDNRYPAVPPSGRSKRQSEGGCGMRNSDIEWANKKAVPIINKTVKDAAAGMAGRGFSNVIFMEVEKAFLGRRLCEKPLRHIFYSGSPEMWWEDGALDKAEWVNQIRIITAWTLFGQQESVHPNFWGQLALRSCLRKVYNSGTPLAGKECVIDATGIQPHPDIKKWLKEPRMKLN